MADLIVVVDGGRIAEQGDHEELVARRRHLRRAVRAPGRRLWLTLPLNAWWRSAVFYADLRPQLRRLGRRRPRRPARHPRAPPVPARARRRRALADAVLPVARRRPRLRRRGLRRRRPAASARSPTSTRSLAEAHDARAARDRRSSRTTLERAPVVPARARARPPGPRAVRLPPRAGRRAAEQLALDLRRPGVDARRAERRLVPAPVRARAARPRLAQRRRPATTSSRSSASGSTAASTASASTSRTGSSRTPSCRRGRALPGLASSRPTGARRSTSPRCTRSTAAGGRSPTPTPATGCSSARSSSPTRRGLRAYVRPDELHLAFNFPFLFSAVGRCAVRATIDATMRVARRGGRDRDVGAREPRRDAAADPLRRRREGRRRARAAALLLLALPGAVFLYQGQELGLEEVDLETSCATTRSSRAAAAAEGAATAAACRCRGTAPRPASASRPALAGCRCRSGSAR